MYVAVEGIVNKEKLAMKRVVNKKNLLAYDLLVLVYDHTLNPPSSDHQGKIFVANYFDH